MKWSPPHIERHHGNREYSLRVLFWLVLLTRFLSGCSALPVMEQSPVSSSSSFASAPLTSAEQLRVAQMAPIPAFDVIGDTASEELQQVSAADQMPETTAAAHPATQSAAIVAGEAGAKTNSSETAETSDAVAMDKAAAAAVAANAESRLPGSANEIAKVAATGSPNKVLDSASSVADAGSASSGSSHESVQDSQPDSGSPKVAATEPTGFRAAPPLPFAWRDSARSTGGRPIMTATVGDKGYRTLLAGSVGGDDPLALALVDALARRLHDDSLILGGFECTLIRTLNPDGEANHSFLNQKGQYINDGFPRNKDQSAAVPSEVAFLLKQLKDIQPQRVVHVRSVTGETGVIAASSSCRAVAKDAADWLKFRLIMLPEGSRNPGSLERYVSTDGSSEIITFAIPETSPQDELWQLYGDTLLNLLLSEDLATRDIARGQTRPSSADRRNANPGE